MTRLIKIHQIHDSSRMKLHDASSACSLSRRAEVLQDSSRFIRFITHLIWFFMMPRHLVCATRIDAQQTTRLITSHQMHSYSHMDLHHDSLLCSIAHAPPRRLPMSMAPPPRIPSSQSRQRAQPLLWPRRQPYRRPSGKLSGWPWRQCVAGTSVCFLSEIH